MITDTHFPTTPFTTQTAVGLGLTKDCLASAVRDCELVRLFKGVYLRSDIELTPLLRAQAAAAVVSPFSVVCDRTAAWIHRVDTRRYGELDVLPPLECCVLKGHHPTDRPEIIGRTRDLLPRDWTEIGGVRVTTPLRTALDLGCRLPRQRALAAVDALMREHGFTRSDLQRELPRFRRRRGVIQLRQLVPIADGRAESPRESWVRLAILDHGLPAPEPQFWVVVDGLPTYRLDLAYPHLRVAIEYDGEDFHTSADDRARDRARRTWLGRNGWTVIVLTKESLTDAGMTVWLRQLRNLIEARA